MSDDIDVFGETLSTRAFTQAEEVALIRVEQFVSQHDFVVQRRPRLALELLIAGVVAAVAVTLIVALTRHSLITPSSAHHTPPPTATATASPPTPSPTASSTVVATPPLAIFFTASTSETYHLQARTYSGELAGSLTIPYSNSGFEVAPDGSKVLDGDEIIGVNARTIGRITWTSATLPTWADDSQHLCGVTYDPSSRGHATLVEFDMSGASRTVATLGPSGPNISWGVVACSPAADRALVEGGPGPGAVIDLLRLSNGTILASHSVADEIGPVVGSHDGRIIALSEPSGVAVRDTSTWALEARIVRWGAPEGYQLIGSAVTASWDGSRILVDAGGASGACHPQWLVDWARNRNILTSTSSVGPLGCSAVLPLTHTATFFVWNSVSEALYLVEDNGTVRKVGG